LTIEDTKSLKKEFNKHNKEHYIMAILNKSVQMQDYDITFECVRIFLPELLTVPYFACLDILEAQFRSDLSKYEAKIALLQRFKPFMKK
jgi:hypothetical protein